MNSGSKSQTLGRACGHFALGVGCLVLVGWALDVPTLKSIAPVWSSMKANTALALALLGVSLTSASASGRRTLLGSGSALVAVAIGLLTLLQYALDLDFRIDEALFSDSPHSVGVTASGRMAGTTAAAFLLIGSALAVFPAYPLAAQVVALALTALFALPLVGYLFGASAVYRSFFYSSVAMHTSLSFVTVCVGILALHADRGVGAIVLDAGPGGRFLRQLLPAGLVLTLLIGWCSLQGYSAGWYGAEFSVAIFAVAVLIFFAGLACWNAAMLDRAERERYQNEETYRLLAEAMPGLVWMLDTQGKLTYVNGQYEQYTGYQREEVNARGWGLTLHADDLPRMHLEWQKLIETGTLNIVELRIRRADGAYRWFSGRTIPIRDQNGKVTHWVGTGTDIEDQKRSLEALRRSERRYRALIQASPQIVWTADEHGLGNDAFQWWSEATGHDCAASDNWGWLNALHPDDREPVRRAWTTSLADKSPYAVDYRIRTPEGEYRHLSVHSLPLFDEAGNFEEWVGTITDVTERIRADEAIRQSEARFRQLADSMPQMVWSSRPDGHTDYFNERWYEFTAMPRNCLGENPCSSILHPDDVRGCLAHWTESIRTLTPYEFECRYLDKKSGTYRWFLSRALPVRDDAGQVVRWYGTVTDIHDQKQLEENLRQIQRELEDRVRQRTADLTSILNASTHVSIIAGDVNGIISHFNPGAERMLGYSAQELVGKTTPALLHLPEEIQEHGERLSQTFGYPVTGINVFVEHARRGGYEEREWTYVRKDGGRLTVNLTVTAQRDARGEISGYLGIATDITKRKQAEAELQNAKAAAESANQAKGEFLANMSHEIRTPMNGILGLTQLVLETELEPQQRDYLQSVQRSAEALLEVINDILDFSKIEAGKLELDPEPFSLRTAVDELLKPLDLRARNKGLDLRCDIADDIPDTLVGDVGRLRQILINLLGNAIKFTPQGSVALALHVQERHGDDLVLQVRVDDTGIGIAEDKRARIFNPFEQADGTMARSFGGTGLGLSISARLAELMEGRIWVESELGRGSQFFCTLRFRAAPDQTAIAPRHSPSRETASETQAPLKILLAEDNVINQQVALGILGKLGHYVRVAGNGQEVLEIIDSVSFDLILMDVQMPEMDGIETTQRLRAAGRTIPIIALTAHAMKGDRERFLAAGMNGYLTKPIDPRALRRELTGHRSAPTETPQPKSEPVLDREQLWARLGGERDFVVEILGLFASETLGAKIKLDQAYAAQNWPALHRLAHQLRGSLANLSAVRAATSAGALGACCRQVDVPGIDNAYIVFRTDLDAALAAFAAWQTELTAVTAP